MTALVRSTACAAVSGFLMRPCCVLPAALSVAGLGTAGIGGVIETYRGSFLLASALFLTASMWITFRRDGGVLNKTLAATASLVGFAIAAGWLGVM